MYFTLWKCYVDALPLAVCEHSNFSERRSRVTCISPQVDYSTALADPNATHSARGKGLASKDLLRNKFTPGAG